MRLRLRSWGARGCVQAAFCPFLEFNSFISIPASVSSSSVEGFWVFLADGLLSLTYLFPRAEV